MVDQNRNPIIYLICGKARHGKDTIGNIIKDCNQGKKNINLSYAYYIKDYAKRISDWNGKDETKPRTLLQFLGTDLIRKKIDYLFFVNRMIEDIKVFSYFFDNIIITDGRFKPEIDKIRDNFSNVVVIHVERPNFDNGITEEEKNHLSEVDLDDYNNYDYKVINDGSIDDLRITVENIIKEVENR